MNALQPGAPAARAAKWLTAGMVALAFAGLALNLMLYYRHVLGGGIAGCGGGSSCDELLSSRWALVFGLPVAGLGGMVYASLLVALAANFKPLVVALLGMILGAAAWFVVLQALVLGRFCPWCMSTHGVGLLLAALGGGRQSINPAAPPAAKPLGLLAAATALALGVVQAFGPQPVTHRIDELGGAATGQGPSVHARGNGRKIEFDDGRKIYDVAALPHLGRTGARRVMVEYFDYSCAACQTMHGFLAALMAKHPDNLAVVVVPVPLEGACNHSLTAADVQHPGSCQLASLALAVWRTRPAAFAAFHQRLLEHPVAAAARSEALKLMTQPELDAALRDPWIDALIQADIHDWVAFSASRKNLPKLLISGKRILHGLPSSEADFIRVMELELGL